MTGETEEARFCRVECGPTIGTPMGEAAFAAVQRRDANDSTGWRPCGWTRRRRAARSRAHLRRLRVPAFGSVPTLAPMFTTSAEINSRAVIKRRLNPRARR